MQVRNCINKEISGEEDCEKENQQDLNRKLYQVERKELTVI
ncbi:hypothetical protein [Eubacterium sp. 14-2]|nr:hypothetical protein [Eubacterium sp. 14-2]